MKKSELRNMVKEELQKLNEVKDYVYRPYKLGKAGVQKVRKAFKAKDPKAHNIERYVGTWNFNDFNHWSETDGHPITAFYKTEEPEVLWVYDGAPLNKYGISKSTLDKSLGTKRMKWE